MKALLIGFLIIAMSALSCFRLRGRPPVEDEPEHFVEIAQEPDSLTSEEMISVPIQRPLEPSRSGGEYRLGYGDVISVRFFYDPEFDQTVTIRPDGRITLPRLGDVLVVGMMPTQLDDLVTTNYAEIIRDPDVTIIVEEIGENVVYVLGEVNEPGGYPLNPYGTTVLGAIALAEGFKNTAKLSSVILIKLDATGMPQPERINLTKAVSGSRKDDPYLQGNEIVYVPSTFISQLNLFMEQFFTKIAPPLDVYLKVYDIVYPERRWRQ